MESYRFHPCVVLVRRSRTAWGRAAPGSTVKATLLDALIAVDQNAAAFLGDERFRKFIQQSRRGGRLLCWQEQEFGGNLPAGIRLAIYLPACSYLGTISLLPAYVLPLSSRTKGKHALRPLHQPVTCRFHEGKKTLSKHEPNTRETAQ